MTGIAPLLQRLIWHGLLAIVAISPTQFAVEVASKTFVSVADPLVWGVFGLWVVSRFGSGDRRPIRYPPLMAFLFMLVAALSLIRAIHPLKGLKDIIQLAEYFVAAFMLFANAPSREQARRLVDVFLVMATFVVLLGAAQYLVPGISDFKVCSTFGNRNVFGGYLALAIPFAAGVAFCEANPWRRAWLLAVAGVALLVTLSGGAMMALVVALGVLCAIRGKPALVAFAVAFTLIFVLVFPRLPRHNDAVLDGSIRLYDDNNEVSLRYTEWQAATVMLAEHPWLGVGLGNYQDNIGGYFGVLPRPTGVVEHDSENLYLVIASSTGWFGLAAFAGLLLTCAVAAARQVFRLPPGTERGVALGALGAMISFSICAIWHPLLVRGIGIPLATIFAFTAAGKPGEDEVD